MGWGEFAAAYIAFFLSHALPISPPIRPWLEARLGRSGFTLAYSVLSIAILGWLIGAAGRAPYVSLWPSASWQNHVPVVVMVPVCLIIALSVARPNPFSFGGARNDNFDPAHPGIVRLTRHPLLLALALWAAAHLVPNGDLAHVILFGTFAVFALLGGTSLTGASCARWAQIGRGCAKRCHKRLCSRDRYLVTWPFALRRVCCCIWGCSGCTR